MFQRIALDLLRKHGRRRRTWWWAERHEKSFSTRSRSFASWLPCSRIDAALATGELSYSKVRAMTRVATAENEGKLLGVATTATAAQLERICRGLAFVTKTPPGAKAARWVTYKRGTGDMVRIEAQLHVGRKTRRIPPSIRRALVTRDKGCRFPGCRHTRWTDAHHILHWLDGGETKLSNLVLLCPHHHRLVHEAGFRMERAGPDVVFRRPDGRILTHASRTPLLPGWALAQLRAANENAGARIDEHTAESEWRGERVDYDHIVGVLM